MQRYRISESGEEANAYITKPTSVKITVIIFPASVAGVKFPYPIVVTDVKAKNAAPSRVQTRLASSTMYFFAEATHVHGGALHKPTPMRDCCIWIKATWPSLFWLTDNRLRRSQKAAVRCLSASLSQDFRMTAEMNNQMKNTIQTPNIRKLATAFPSHACGFDGLSGASLAIIGGGFLR